VTEGLKNFSYLEHPMKIATEIMLQAVPQKIWETLIDFSRYPEWNRFLKTVSGQPAMESQLDIELQYYGKNVEKKIATVTGFTALKYFSYTWKHSYGAWFLTSEHIFRLKDKEDGRTVFFQEIYVTGLSLRFRRRDVEHNVKLSMMKLNDDIKDRVE
jgi:hypothetical protein